MEEQAKQAQIERYLAGELTEAEQQLVEQRIQTDEAFRQEVQLQGELATALADEELLQFRESLKNVDQNWSAPSAKTTATTRQLWPRALLAVAAVGLLLLLTYPYLFPANSLSSQQLYAQYFEPYPMRLNQRTAPKADERSQKIAAAIALYEREEYLAASDAFRVLKAPITAPDVLYLYTAVADLAEGNAKAAIPTLENLHGYAPPLYVEQARWYLALAYLLDEQPNMAKSLLLAIEPGQYQYAAAQEILGKIDE